MEPEENMGVFVPEVRDIELWENVDWEMVTSPELENTDWPSSFESMEDSESSDISDSTIPSVSNPLLIHNTNLSAAPLMIRDPLVSDAILVEPAPIREHSYSLPNSLDLVSVIPDTQQSDFDEEIDILGGIEEDHQVDVKEETLIDEDDIKIELDDSKLMLIDSKETTVRKKPAKTVLVIRRGSMSESKPIVVVKTAKPPVKVEAPSGEIKKNDKSVLKIMGTKSLPKKCKLIHPSQVTKTEPPQGFSLPPTPPSPSTSSDNEGGTPMSFPITVKKSIKKEEPDPIQLASRPHTIQTSLISSQPKGSTGVLNLTDEEIRTLVAEGYPVPTRLPLTKGEEKMLKKVRRKIKNKLSAQESRRKKKEYLDSLERQVEILSAENTSFRKRIISLEEANKELIVAVETLQALVSRS